ncbi:hypothetical protein HDV03_003392 [Kappamyces sp. JEL0829]|nr:hypothetical protein HDV03_003392 [Kappamyces sp. JEL0829]
MSFPTVSMTCPAHYLPGFKSRLTPQTALSIFHVYSVNQSSLVSGSTLFSNLVFSDEFNGNGLPDPSKWSFDTFRNKDGWFNNELQYYSNRVENCHQSGGVLHIVARKEALSQYPDWGGQQYSSARLITSRKADWNHGFMEIRAKLPCGAGTWPAIWLVGYDQWPLTGEIDIMEQTGRDPTRILGTIHTQSTFDQVGGQGASASTQIGDACNAFHNYQLTWTDQLLSIGVDGRVFQTYAKNPSDTNYHWPFNGQHFMILNLAIGGTLGGAVDNSIFGANGRELQIDYVRVYQ